MRLYRWEILLSSDRSLVFRKDHRLSGSLICNEVLLLRQDRPQGRKVSKADLFEIERGELAHAPMIQQCPLSMELRLKEVIVLGHHEIFVGEIVNTYIQETCLTDEKPDLEKIDPILFDMMKLDYWSLGRRTGKPWRDGKALKKKS